MNGRLAASQLAAIPGRSRLRRDAAAAYTAMHRESVRRFRVSLAIYDATIGRGYRSLAQQYAAKRMYGSNAAYPGTSNHGLGLAVDLHTRQQRWVIDQIGRLYGWRKTEAFHEFWHINYVGGYQAQRSPSVLRKGATGSAVRKVQRQLRRKNVKGSPRVTGYFGDATEAAVRRFQRKHGLRPDGAVGPRTRRLLAR